MASYSRLLLRMLPLRRWALPGLGPVWLGEPQPACRVLWPCGRSLMDRVANDMEKQFQEMEEKMTRAFFQALPALTWDREGRTEACGDGVARDQPDGKYRFSVDVAGFTPEEMEVKLDGRRVTVTVKRRRESGSKESGYWRERQELRRETLLPPDVDLHGVTCSLASDGQLCIEAPRLAFASTTGKAIPIDVKPDAQETPDGEKPSA
ncbi:heat shock protein 30C-like [Elgaria multicarinata webbii]|uniref:heat shock protein 30C-like n=1 Tax=Elgaria multicarinata webbii TaxID=159646 RepID=UPI002FCD6B15